MSKKKKYVHKRNFKRTTIYLNEEALVRLKAMAMLEHGGNLSRFLRSLGT